MKKVATVKPRIFKIEAFFPFEDAVFKISTPFGPGDITKSKAIKLKVNISFTMIYSLTAH
jgi:hypothetical protein